jgi:hypothetical protein
MIFLIATTACKYSCYTILTFTIYSCWIRPDYVEFGIILPTSLIIGADIVCTLVAAWRFFPSLFSFCYRDRNVYVYKGGSRQLRREKFIALLLMQFTLGAPWVRHIGARFQLTTCISGFAILFSHFVW